MSASVLTTQVSQQYGFNLQYSYLLCAQGQSIIFPSKIVNGHSSRVFVCVGGGGGVLWFKIKQSQCKQDYIGKPPAFPTITRLRAEWHIQRTNFKSFFLHQTKSFKLKPIASELNQQMPNQFSNLPCDTSKNQYSDGQMKLILIHPCRLISLWATGWFCHYNLRHEAKHHQ